jgi:5-methylcytosine-specific restriction enzyme subunit McrC
MSRHTPDRPVVLTEYDSAPIDLDVSQVRLLRRLARGAVTLQLDDTASTWSLTSSHYVGTIVIPGVRILITPKVPAANLFYLLEASGKPVDIGPAAFDYDTTRDLIPAFATFYARHLETALGRGVPRAYREAHERLPGIRGRVDLPAQLRLAGLPLPAECRFDEYTADTRLTRVLRGAALRLLRLPGVTIPTRQALQRLAAMLGEAGPCTPEDIRVPTVFTRLDEHCRPAERLARMVLGNQTLAGAAGTANAGVFLIDMNTAFETFVAARLSRYLAGHLTVCPQQTKPFGLGGPARIRPDLIFERPAGTAVYVADTKYKITADGYARDTDYYQILAYTRALDVPAGMLIYCQRDGDAPPTAITVGAHQTRLDTVALTLNGSPADLERRLGGLADQIIERAAAYPRHGDACLPSGRRSRT